MTAPYKSGRWQADDIHDLYWELYGNPKGTSAIVIHGGPGNGRDVYLAEYFDLQKYNVLMFDQRGCGLSSPAGCCENNTTKDLLSDIEGLRLHLNIGKALIIGGSWGATLALEYAKAYTASCTALIIYSPFIGRPQDEEWFIKGTRQFYPDYHAALTGILTPAEKNNIIDSYKTRLNSADEMTRRIAASAFLNYTTVLLPLRFEDKPLTTPQTITVSDINSVQIFLHYSSHNYFLNPGGALEGIETLSTLSGRILQGRYDMDTPPLSAWELSQRWHTARLEFIPACGHSDTEPPMKAALIKAISEI